MGMAAFGSTLAVSGTITELKTITGPGVSMEPIDITNHSSTDQFKEFVAGLSDGGEYSVTGNLTDTPIDDIILSSQIPVAFAITVPVTSTTNLSISGDCLCTKYEGSAPYDAGSEFSASFKITGKPSIS